MVQWLGYAVLAGAMALGSAALAQGAGPTGTWLTENGKARVKIAPCGGNLCGNVVWLAEPKGDDGKPKLDINNADSSKRTRPILGSAVLLGMKPAGESWKGSIYNAEDGKTYSATISLADGNTLKVEGCVAAILCKKQTWSRAQ
jgi:uncharacterized protein (DUF2147 family)